MSIRELAKHLAKRHTIALERYERRVTELKGLVDSGVPRDEYYRFCQEVVDPAGQDVRCLRLALEKHKLGRDPDRH